MVKLKFVVKDNNLVLRISENKERFYRSARTVLVGNPNLKHWNAGKEKFTYNAPSFRENNEALEQFKLNFQKLVNERPELSAREISTFYDSSPSTAPESAQNQNSEDKTYSATVEKFLDKVIEREKAKPGCNFEVYQKLQNKCRRIFPDWSDLTFRDIDYDKCIEIASVFAQYDGYFNTAKQFRNMLGKAHRDRNVPFRISHIGDFKFSDYDPKKNESKVIKPKVLTALQVKAFLNADPIFITPDFKDRNLVRLNYDFCVFMLNSLMAPCDVIKLKCSDITSKHVIVAKRKKTHRAIEIPITPAMDKIIARYAPISKDGYIFPIMDDEQAKQRRTKDYIFKKYRQQLNVWLKSVGRELEVDFDLYAYVFRHTAITMALDNGLPISYVAIIAGTNIEMIQKHYYNGDSLENSRRLQLMFINAAK